MQTSHVIAAGFSISIVLASAWVASCTQSSSGDVASAGSSGRGGSAGSGGVAGAGATASSGGATASGGNASGGATTPGGSTSSGGTSASGGTPGGGGTSTTGGNAGAGGANPDAGARDSGRDASATGGTIKDGGATATGGSPGTGGVTAVGSTGGTTATGGSTSTGGTSTGRTGTGGATSTGGSIGAVTTTCPGAVPTGTTSSWCSCEQWGQWANGSYTYYNDIWGSGAGAQCIWATTANKWGVAANHPTTSGIKSYPNISISPAKAISAISDYTSSFDVSVPSSGAYETTYDLWVKGTTSSRIEIMLWMNYTGAVGPIASAYDASGKPVADKANVTVGGHSWNVYFGTNGSNDVVSFVRTSNTSAGNVDIKALLLWIIANATTRYGVFTSSWTLDQVQFGFEITSDGSTQAFVTNSFSVT